MKLNATNPFDADAFETDDFVESGGIERSPITVVLRELRGRYMLTAALGAVFAVIFGIAGYSATSPKYSSKGWIRIAPTQAKILYEAEGLVSPSSKMIQMAEDLAQSSPRSRPS